MLLITFGLMVTTAGEVKFDPYGFLMQAQDVRFGIRI
jgi:hypothetical protein